MNDEGHISSSDSSSVITGNISQINLTETDNVNNNNSQRLNADLMKAWDSSANLKVVLTIDGATERNDLTEDFPFFLKDIDISSDILKTDPNERKEDSKVKSTGDVEPASKVVQTGNSVTTGNSVSAANNVAKSPKSNSSSNSSNSSNLQEQEFNASKNLLEEVEVKNSSVSHLLNNIVDLKPIDVAIPSSQRKNSYKRESTGGSSVTITNSVNSDSTSQSRESSAGEDYASNIRVVVRVRPLSLPERQRGDRQCIQFSGGGGLQVEGGNSQSKGFTFNAVLSEKCTQQQVFQESGIQNLIDKALDGFSCTVFAFGPTGSGKTHTIIGPSEQSIEDMIDHKEVCGLVVRSFGYLFECTEKRSSVQYIIKASFLEVYNEKVKDLLNPSNAYDTLPVRWSSKKGFYVENLFCVECETSQDLMTLLVEGSNYRQIGVHAINEHSSRSHTIFTVYLESEEVDSDDEEGFPLIRHGKISFIDLAGSERVKETKTTVDALAESNNINKSLLALGNCISALGDRKKRGHHVPYRDSKLTKLLADSLGGGGFTIMIACISPSLQNWQDTMNALRYANRAKDIKNKPVVKMDPKEQLLHRMKREIKLLRTENHYFRQQQGVPCSESQIIITPNDIDGELTPNSSGVLSPAIGNGSGTLSSLHSSPNNSAKDLNLTNLYALGAKNGIYDILQEYMNENENLKAENMELHRSRAIAHRQQEEMSRENERLTRKLGELGRVMLASPISRENIKLWINEANSTSDIFSPSSIAEISSVKGKSPQVKFPPVRKGSYPNYVTVDLSDDVEFGKQNLYTNKDLGKSVPESKLDVDLSPRKKTDKDTSEETVKTEKNNGKKTNADESSKLNTNLHSNVKQNKKLNKSPSNKNVLNSSGDKNEKQDAKSSSNVNKNVEKTKDDKKYEHPLKLMSKRDIKAKKKYHPKPWRAKRKPMSVDKPSGYAAQFAARKGQVPRLSTQSEVLSVTSDVNRMQNYQVESALYSLQPSPYSYVSSQPTPYMNTPLYNYNASYPYYMGLTPQLHGLPMNVYENMSNQLQQDLESLNGQLRSEAGYDMCKKTKPPR